MPPLHRPYVAYGSNMCRRQMAARCPGAQALGIVTLPGRRFVINCQGYATLVPDPAAQAYGLVWALDAEHERSLDGYEGVAEGDYRKELVVLPEHGEALIYIAADPTPGRPHPDYFDAVLAAALAAALPSAYRAELARWRAA